MAFIIAPINRSKLSRQVNREYSSVENFSFGLVSFNESKAGVTNHFPSPALPILFNRMPEWNNTRKQIIMLVSITEMKVGSSNFYNCRSPRLCPLYRICSIRDVVYKDVVKEEDNLDKIYIRSTLSFKAWYRTYTNSFLNEKYCNYTALASYMHRLKRNNKSSSPEWSIISRIPYFNV